MRGECAAGVAVHVVFVHQAAFELGALPRQLLRVERQLLHACGVGGNARKVGYPRRAAQLASAGSDAAYAAGLLAGADLLHLDAYAEPVGENLYQFAEVDPLVGYVVEYGLDLVALILHVADLHVEAHVGGYLTRGDHRLVFEGYGLLPALYVVGLGLAVYLLVFAVEGVEAHAPHLARHHVARERYDADVVSGRGLDGHYVAAAQVEPRCTSGNTIGGYSWKRHPRKMSVGMLSGYSSNQGVSWSLKHPSTGIASTSSPQSQNRQPRPISGICFLLQLIFMYNLA